MLPINTIINDLVFRRCYEEAHNCFLKVGKRALEVENIEKSDYEKMLELKLINKWK